MVDAQRDVSNICSRWDWTNFEDEVICEDGGSGCRCYLGVKSWQYIATAINSHHKGWMSIPNLPKGQATAQIDNKET